MDDDNRGESTFLLTLRTQNDMIGRLKEFWPLQWYRVLLLPKQQNLIYLMDNWQISFFNLSFPQWNLKVGTALQLCILGTFLVFKLILSLHIKKIQRRTAFDLEEHKSAENSHLGVGSKNVTILWVCSLWRGRRGVCCQLSILFCFILSRAWFYNSVTEKKVVSGH